MTSYLSRLLSEDKPDEKPDKNDSYLGRLNLFGTPEETGSIGDTPLNSLFSPEGKQEDPAGMGTHYKAGHVDSMKSKIKIYSKARGISEDRYGVHEGEIVYLGDDKKLYRETPDSWWEQIKRFSADTGAHAPSIGLSIILGVISGPGGAAIGAAGGEGYRKVIGATAFDEEQTAKENIKGMATEGALAFGGDVAGRGIGRTINYLGAKRGGKLAAEAGIARGDIDIKKVKELEKLGKQFGIDLYAPQTTGSKRLADKFNLLGDMDASADIIQTAREVQGKQINEAAYKFLDDISKSKGRLKTGEDLVKSADNIVKKAKTVRGNKVRPLYEEAYKTRGVDTFNTILALEDKLSRQPVGSPAHRAINLLKKQLTRKVEAPDGKLWDVPEDRVELIDKIKKGINSKWKKDPVNSPSADMQQELNDVLDTLIKSADEVAPAYKEGRELFKELSPAIDKLKASKVGELANLKNDKTISGAIDNLFSPSRSTPDLVAFARQEIIKENPEAWNSAIRLHLQKIFEGPKESAIGAITNKGGHFYKNVWGDMSQREILRAGMGAKQFGVLEDFMTVLKRSGVILNRESATATRSKLIEEIAGTYTNRIVRAITRPLYTYHRLIGDRFMEATINKNAKNLARVMTSESAAKQLKSMRQLSPGSEKLLPALGNFLAQVMGGEYLEGEQEDIAIGAAK